MGLLLNPVKARLCELAEEWEWSSTGAHILGCDDRIVSVAPMLGRISDWRSYLLQGESDNDQATIRQCLSSGRPAGDELFTRHLEQLTGRDLRKKKPGPKT